MTLQSQSNPLRTFVAENQNWPGHWPDPIIDIVCFPPSSPQWTLCVCRRPAVCRSVPVGPAQSASTVPSCDPLWGLPETVSRFLGALLGSSLAPKHLRPMLRLQSQSHPLRKCVAEEQSWPGQRRPHSVLDPVLDLASSLPCSFQWTLGLRTRFVLSRSVFVKGPPSGRPCGPASDPVKFSWDLLEARTFPTHVETPEPVKFDQWLSWKSP